MGDTGKADYDTSVISVSPSGLKTVGKELAGLSKDVVTSLNKIHTTLDGLKVSWQGKAASDADEVNEEWMRVMKELFGTKEDPHKGVLPALADGVGMAAFNFSTAEDGVAEAFTKFREGLTSKSGDDKPKDTPPDAVTDTNKTAVTMTFD
ncbi:WXG100 family type VII secretion target [Streptomyces sp. NPDC057654]|uniref:WXG100 family type VII secretion target n=1 Tax=Streptomyces sp. NPDC057654 TaxID=3346196 RepID=UPI0036ADAFC9